MCLFYYKYNEEDNVVETIYIKCSNCRRSTGLYLKDKTFQEIITQFVLNKVLYNVGLYWIISSKKQVEYDMEEKNPDWLNKVPCYNTAICSKLHGTVFEDYINRGDFTNLFNPTSVPKS